MSEYNNSPLPQSTAQWRLEQFEAINRAALIAAGAGFGIYLIAFAVLHYWTTLVVALLLAALFGLFYASGRIARSGNVERGTNLFAYSLTGFLVASYLFQRDPFTGFNLLAMLVPMALATYLLEAQPARRIAIVSSVAIILILLLAVLQPYPLPVIPLAFGLIVNLLAVPTVLAFFALVSVRSSERSRQSITRLEQQSAALEVAIRRRTAQLTTAAEIGRAATGSFNLDELLMRTVNLIRDRFGYYHASVFLVDEDGLKATVQASTGDVGQILMQRKHTLGVGSQSIIGYVTAQRKARVALDVGQDVVHFKNPLLTDTRSEIGIPLVAGDKLLGALDVQSKEPNAFTAADVSVLQALADQLAIAVNNARLFASQQRLAEENQRLLAESQQSIEELNALTGKLSREGWQNFSSSGRADVSVFSALDNLPALPEPGEAMGLAVEKRDIVSTSENDRAQLAAPIILRDQIIGALALEENDPTHRWSADDLALAHEIADRLGLALDNARLLEQVNRERERLTFLFEAARALSASLDINTGIQTTLGFATRIGAQHGSIILTPEFGSNQYALNSSMPGMEQLPFDQADNITRTLTTRGVVKMVLESGAATVVYDAQIDPRWPSDPDFLRMPARSFIIAPLRSALGKVAGVLTYSHNEPNAFTEDQIPFIESISVQVSAALNNALLYQQVRTQQFGSSALARATQIMSRALTDDELMQSLADQLFEVFQPNGAVFFRWNVEAGTLMATGLRVAASETDLWPAHHEPFPAANRLDLLDVMRSRRGRIQKIRAERDGQVRESMAMPFIFNDQVDGVVELTHTGAAYGLSAEDMGLMQSLLTSAAFALQSARLYQQLTETAERLREIDRLKSQFLANMSHELRTPLNSIIGFSRVIMKGIDGPVNEVQLQDLSAINSAGQHLLGLINDLLDISRIEAGKMELNFDRVDFNEIAKGVMSTTLGLIKDKPIKLIPDISADLPPIHADAIRVRQVLLNLMSNASKFTDEGTITVRARVVQQEGRRPMVEINVTDTGPGIPEQDINKLFQTFSQVDGSATRKVGGSGLGLSISKNLVELHGGTVWVESTVGVGSTFSFNVPVHIEEEKLEEVQPAQPLFEPHKVRTVLAIDDDARLIDLYRRYLEPKGFTLHGLINPREAVAAARALKPQIILLDVVMPDYDGWKVMNDLKGHAETRDIPVIICSILAEQEKARSLGATDYLVKPILDVDLVAALSKLNGSGPGYAGNGNGRGKTAPLRTPASMMG